MDIIKEFLSIDTIAFTVIGYQMSYIELIGTLFYLWSVWLIAQRKMLTWPIGIISSLLYLVLFYQIRLYSDAAEQLYYIFASVYGWWFWQQSFIDKSLKTIKTRISSPKTLVTWFLGTMIISIGVSEFFSRIHIFFPIIFPEPASFPLIDAFTTIMSFTAMFLMAQRRLESWVYWIIVDVIGIGLYFIKGVKFISLLYVVLLFIAVKGLIGWMKERELIRNDSKLRNFV